MRNHPNELRITLRPSRLLVGFLAFAHIGALLCLLLSGLSAWLIGVGGGLLIISLTINVLKCFRNAVSGAATMLGYSLDGQWWLSDGIQQRQQVELLPGSMLHPLLAVLNFRLSAGGKKRLLLLPDMLGMDEMRRLRVAVRMGAL